MKLKVYSDVSNLEYARHVYANYTGITPDQQSIRFQDWWAYGTKNNLNTTEYLLPQIHISTKMEPFSFERRFLAEGKRPPSRTEIEAHNPWVYQIEFGDVGTRGKRDDADWLYHRYRANMIGQLLERMLPAYRRKHTSILDIACHCGVFSLEFAERGFQQVRGLDLRESNIAQAKFLAKTFSVSPAPTFMQGNAAHLEFVAPADVIFCAGLLYHVTFPMELLANLYRLTNEVLILDTLVHRYPFSAFFLVCGKSVDMSTEGGFHYEFHPTYRAVCDGLFAVGFKNVYEVIGSDAARVPNYNTGNVRTFVASKKENSVFDEFLCRECEFQR